MKSHALVQNVIGAFLCLVVVGSSETAMQPVDAGANEPFVIAASPSLKDVLERLGSQFEENHPGVRVQLYFDSGLGASVKASPEWRTAW